MIILMTLVISTTRFLKFKTEQDWTISIIQACRISDSPPDSDDVIF